MSMEQLTIVQCVLAFFIYTGLTVVLPALVLHPKVAHCRAVTRFFVYFSVGNFYIMNLVYVLELMKISCWPTLVAGTLLPAGVAYVKVRKIPLLVRLKAFNEQMDRVIRGSFGAKNWLRRCARRLAGTAAGGARAAMRGVRVHFMDCLMVAVVVAVVLGYYGPALIKNFGYCTSDVSVHNYWINSLAKNEIFVAGVYPFGFHNIIYYIHTVFRVDTYVLLRVFWLVQVLWIHLILMMFLKGVCKSRFLPYAGVIIYTLAAFSLSSYERYYASLPQEFGMLFILPAVYFAFEFFRIKKEELKGKREYAVSKWYLVGFALNFAMTFSVHFYGTIILGVFCVGIACGYVWRFLQPKYFIKVVKTCFIGLFVALLPMAIAYMSGTMLDGSLRWAMGVMSSSGEDLARKEYDENGIPLSALLVELENGTLAYEDVLEDGSKVYYPLDALNLSQEEKEELIEESYNDQADVSGAGQDEDEASLKEQISKIGKKLKKIWRIMNDAMIVCQFSERAQSLRYLVYASLLVMPFAFLLLLFLRRPDEAFSLVSAGVNVLGLVLMIAAPKLNLPTIMQQSRVCIYLNYSLPVLWIMTADRVLYILFGIWRSKWMRRLMNTASLAVAVAGCILLVQMDLIKPETQMQPFQSNEAVTCLTNIIHEEEDYTWTIVSVYDEMRMGEDHGYHEELITFLQDMEYTGGISMITIPSKTVYFFIEKRPLDYSAEYQGSGQLISQSGASRPLPSGDGFDSYMGENRWIVMSRFYEWAQSFRGMYPHEMTIYYENENFICYKLEQNDYHLFNLSIDYGYNMR